MAGKTARGLGKGLDSLIPDAVGEAKAKKESEESKDSPRLPAMPVHRRRL